MGKSRQNRNKPKKPPIIRYESSGRLDGDSELKASPSMTSLSSDASASSNENKPVSERRGVILLAAACFLLWFLYTPRLLHRAGVIENDPYEEFLESTVYPSLERGLARINANYTNTEHETDQASRPGYKLKKRGAVAKYPIVIVPGFVTSGLELWEGEDCAKKHFRQRFWGSISMARTFFADRECWRRHLSLDPYTGGDPALCSTACCSGI